MNDWHNFFNHVDDNLANSPYRIFEEQSKAEILTWFSREDVAKELKEDFIQALVEFKDDCGDFYRYRAYFLAAEALNYFKDCSLGDAIALQILKWSYAFFRQDKQDWQTVTQPLVEAARVALETTDRQRVISAFVHLIHTTESRSILRVAAEKLGKLDPGNKSAIAALVLLLEVPQRKPTIWKTTRSLMQITENNPAVIPTIFKLIQANVNGWSHCYACHWYTVGIGSEIVINALVQLIQTITDAEEIVRTVENLGRIATGNETAINALIKLMQTTVDKYICSNAVICLGEIALGNQTAIAALTEFLQINQGDYICSDAAKALWQIDEGNKNAIATLVQIVAVDKFYWSFAANYLWRIAPKNMDVISALTERINTGDEFVCYQVAAILLKLEPGNEIVISVLWHIGQNKEDLSFCQQLAGGLVRRNHNNQLAIDTLFEIVQYFGQSPPHPEEVKAIAWDAIQSLQKIDPSNQLAVSAILNLLNTAQKDTNLHIAVKGLGRLAKGNKDAIAALTKLLDSIEEDNEFLRYTASKLGSIDLGNQKAISTLVGFIQTFDEWNNTEIDNAQNSKCWWRSDSQLLDAAMRLQEILPINQMPQVVVALKDYLSKPNWDNSYRYEACYSLIWHCAQNMSYPDFYEAWHKLS